MDCTGFKSNIFAFTEGTLSEKLLGSAKEHLESCTTCARLSVEFSQVVGVIGQDKITEPNPFASTRILQHLENAFDRSENRLFKGWIRILQPVTIAMAVLSGILIGSYTAQRDDPGPDRMVNSSENIEFLRSNLFISDFADEDKILVLNNE